MFELDYFDKITGIISHFTIIVAMMGLIMQLIQYRITNKAASKTTFTSGTSRYMKIQEILLSDDSLSHLNLGIYKDRISGTSGKDPNIYGKELALSAMMFQVMEDAWLTLDLQKAKNDPVYSGWPAVFKDWMNTKEIAEKWPILKHQFGKPFETYVEDAYLPAREDEPKTKA